MEARRLMRRFIDSIFSPGGGAEATRYSGSTSRTLLSGGVRNPVTGLGGFPDHTEATYFVPNVIQHRDGIQTFYVQSWIAARFIDMPIDDMFINGRLLAQEDQAAVTTFEEAWDDLELEDKITRAMKAGRAYGTGLMCLMVADGPPDTPLDPNNVREGDFKTIHVYDRFDATIQLRDKDPYSPRYLQPLIYRIHPRYNYEPFDIHASRVIRFDGRRPLNTEGWSGVYDRRWGLSELLYAINEILHDAALTGGIAHLAQEASMLVMKIDSFSDALMGDVGPDTPSVEKLATSMNTFKSIFRTIFTDKEVDVDRINYNFAGMHELMLQFGQRLAAIAGIPYTRFMAQSPGGLNATGQSDLSNYAIHVLALQHRMLKSPLRTIDALLARHIGLRTPLPYTFRPLLDLSMRERAEIDEIRTRTLLLPFAQGGVIDENEVRERLAEMELFGELPPLDEMTIESREESRYPTEPAVTGPPSDSD